MEKKQRTLDQIEQEMFDIQMQILLLNQSLSELRFEVHELRKASIKEDPEPSLPHSSSSHPSSPPYTPEQIPQPLSRDSINTGSSRKQQMRDLVLKGFNIAKSYKHDCLNARLFVEDGQLIFEQDGQEYTSISSWMSSYLVHLTGQLSADTQRVYFLNPKTNEEIAYRDIPKNEPNSPYRSR